MKLIYINPLNKNYKGEFIYEFLFGKSIEINYGNDWDILPASSGEITPPPLDEIKSVGVLSSDEIELELAINSDNFSMCDCIENIIAIGWEKNSPPNDERLVFHFGEDLESIKDKIYSRDKVLDFIKK